MNSRLPKGCRSICRVERLLAFIKMNFLCMHNSFTLKQFHWNFELVAQMFKSQKSIYTTVTKRKGEALAGIRKVMRKSRYKDGSPDAHLNI